MNRLTGQGSVHLLQSIFPGISSNKTRLLEHYVDLLLSYNRRINLISRSDTENIWENHILPSLVAEKTVPLPRGMEVMDLGSGGGLPGIPLKILRPDLRMVLLDSSRRKTAFLRTVMNALNLGDISVVTARLPEDIERFSLEKRFDAVFARAVANFESLVGLSMPVLRQEGFLLAWKGMQDLEKLPLFSADGRLRIEVFTPDPEVLNFPEKIRLLRFVKIVMNTVSSSS
jgi:16S rRNA (guanine527-N7)-methyltransferase